MLEGKLAISLNLLSIAVLAFAIGVALITIASRLFPLRLEASTFGVRKLILWSMVTAPWWISVVCVFFFWPSQQESFPTQWFNNLAHWHHIDIFSFTSWHSATLIAASLFLTWSVVKAAYLRRRQSSSLSDLINLSSVKSLKTNECRHYLSLPAAVPAAFTAGLFSPRIYLTTALQTSVSEQELDIIVRHEQAHVAAYDPLRKVVFTIFAGFLPAVARNQLIDQFTLLTEQMADIAVTKEYDSLDVAQTLINVARIQRPVTVESEGLQASYFGNDQTSIRVQHLVNPAFSSSGLTMVLSFIMLSTTLLLTASTVDSLHHIIEAFFTH